MPHSVFVWTFQDVFGLAMLAVIVVVIVSVFVYYWVQETWRKITRRKKNKVAGFTSHNRQITKPAACEKCDYDYASIACSTCGTWIINKQRQAS